MKIENKLTKLEKDILLSFKNERNLNESLAVSAIKSNQKLFYTYAKNNAKVKAEIGSLIKNEVVISDKRIIAQVLREQYDSVYSKPDENCLIDDPVTLFSTTNSESPSLTNIDFERQDLVTSIMQISNKSAAGPDNFPAILLKKCSVQLSLPFQILWKASLRCAKMPSLLKTACRCACARSSACTGVHRQRWA